MREDTIHQLKEAMFTTIVCGECEETVEGAGEKTELANYLFSTGWRVFGGQPMCPKCVYKQQRQAA